jgi:hypothetical protein
MLELTPARRAQLVVAGRIGGLTTAARIDTEARAESGQLGFRERFRDGHECRICPPTAIPTNLPEGERARRSEALYRAHMVRIASRRR